MAIDFLDTPNNSSKPKMLRGAARTMFHLLISLALIVSASACQSAPRYKQVLIGFNGPSTPQTTYFHDAQSAQISWLSRALNTEQLNSLLSQVSFDSQMLVVTAVGERDPVTGRLEVDPLSQNENSLMVYLLIGVNECTGPHAKSYPFAVAVVDRPVRFDGIGNYFHQNFPDGCKAVKSGVPND
mgnify:CR=1 FL=1